MASGSCLPRWRAVLPTGQAVRLIRFWRDSAYKIGLNRHPRPERLGLDILHDHKKHAGVTFLNLFPSSRSFNAKCHFHGFFKGLWQAQDLPSRDASDPKKVLVGMARRAGASYASHRDVGCGCGLPLILKLAEAWPECHFTGLDIAPSLLDLKWLPPSVAHRIHFVQANYLERLPFDDDSFDMVLCGDLGSSVPEHTWQPIMEEVARVCQYVFFCCKGARDKLNIKQREWYHRNRSNQLQHRRVGHDRRNHPVQGDENEDCTLCLPVLHEPRSPDAGST
jgi:hypothetical protein